MSTTERLLTAEEFACLPEPSEGGKMELVRGEVRKMAPVGGEHGQETTNLIVPLALFVRQNRLGHIGPEIGFRLARDPDSILAPDVAFIAHSSLPGGALPATFIEGPPTLAVEVMSPDDRAEEVHEKIEAYLAAGCERVWVVQPRTKTVTVHRPGGDAHTYHPGESLSSDDAAFGADGFSLPIGDIFLTAGA